MNGGLTSVAVFGDELEGLRQESGSKDTGFITE
jgi:hypothetical protein